jgi:hypothetical protein
MDEVTQSIQHTASHPNISFMVYQILSIRINDLRRSIHWCCHAFDILLDWIVVTFTYRCEVVCLFCTRTKIAKLIIFIFTQKNVLYFNVSMVESCLMDWFKTQKNVKCYFYKLLLCEPFVFSLLQ